MRYREIAREQEEPPSEKLSDLADQRQLAADKLKARSDVLQAQEKLKDKQAAATQVGQEG